jgi:hypothetical protein
MTEDTGKWYEIILNNWSQITVLLGAIGFVVQKLTDWRMRKREITFSKLQENKVLEIKSFYKSYLSLELALKDFLYQTQFGEHKDEIFRDQIETVRKCFIDFGYNSMVVKIFLDSDDLKTVDEISKILETTNHDLRKWHIYKTSQNPPKGWDKLEEIMNERFPKTLPTLLKKIETSLRKNYNLT